MNGLTMNGQTAPANVPVHEAMRAAVEDFVAKIQTARVGLQPWDAQVFRARREDLAEALRATNMGALVDGLLADDALPSIADAFCEIDAPRQTRRQTYARWCQVGRDRLPQLWHWARALQRSGRWDDWWWPRNPPPAEATLVRLRSASAEVTDIGGIVERWADTAGVSEAEYDWRWLGLGRGLPLSMPDLSDVVQTLALQLRRHGMLPPEHTVKFVRQRNKPAHVAPIRLPGQSVFFVSRGSPPLCVQFIQHELAHLAEHACRPAHAPLRDRWALDPVRSEGWAMLCELAVRNLDTLQRLGLTRGDAQTLAEFLAQEERFNRGLMAADLALYERVGHANTIDDALEAARAVAARCGLSWSPEVMLFRLPHIGLWRTYLAAWAWRDEVAAELCRQFGPSWSDDALAWSSLRRALATTGGADAWIEQLKEERR